ncbi:MAG: UvrD-helicase domain-containing protein, partial [Acidovorax sp.]
ITPRKAAGAIIDALASADPAQCLAMLRKALFVAKEDRLSKNLEKFGAAQEAEPELKRLLAARHQHAAWQHQQRMARLTRCLIAQFAAVKHQRGWVDMNDVERMAQVLLADSVMSAWVQERLDARVRHLLIDEFQDTNPLQWQALHGWLSGYAGSGGGAAAPSVFVVGDPKQSIFRFRRAEPQVFIAAQAFVSNGLGGDLLSCDHTRRNATGVIAAVNEVMGTAQARGETSGFRPHTTESADVGVALRLPVIGPDDGAAPAGVSDAATGAASAAGTRPAKANPMAWRDSLTEPRHEPEETLRMRECTQAAAWVAAQIAQGVPPKEVMVLARKRDRLATMQDALRALHVPCVQPEKTDLFDAPEVQDIIALLDALVSTRHDLSLARALRSPLFGLADDALVTLAVLRRAPENAACSWFELLQKKELSDEYARAAGANLVQYKAWVDALPPHDALHAIYEHADVLARFAAAAPVVQRASVQANLRALLSAALQHDGGRYLTPYAFVRAMKKGGVRAPGRVDLQAVRLLTVHGAKGLEAHSVLLLDTDPNPQKAETMGVLVDWPGVRAVPAVFLFMSRESAPPPSTAQALAAEQQARQREDLNLLYVAMTRAKQCLAVSSTKPSRSAPGNWWSRLASLPVDGALQTDAPDAVAQNVFTVDEIPCLPSHLQGATSNQQPLGGTGPTVVLAGMTEAESSTPQSRLGEAMHQLLEQAGNAGRALQQVREQGFSAARRARLAQDFDITMAAAGQACQMAQRILAGEGAWAWEPAFITTAINEAPLRSGGQGLRIDRLVHCHQPPSRAGWWVLDYKSAQEPERQPELIDQMELYRQAVQNQTPGERVFAAFLTGDGRLVPVTDRDAAAVVPLAAAAAAPARPDVATDSPVPSNRAQGSLF